ncbi:MAG TPA: hypothetical protein VJB38_00325 [Bacteroidota bacterium]|nr:hypothetical protein [Bacteroidota bacterium]
MTNLFSPSVLDDFESYLKTANAPYVRHDQHNLFFECKLSGTQIMDICVLEDFPRGLHSILVLGRVPVKPECQLEVLRYFNRVNTVIDIGAVFLSKDSLASFRVSIPDDEKLVHDDIELWLTHAMESFEKLMGPLDSIINAGETGEEAFEEFVEEHS